MVNEKSWRSLIDELKATSTTLIAVSKKKPASDIQALYDLGQRDFGENYVQELEQKEAELPKDIIWHFIGHLQSNKVKYIAPFVSHIHGVDSFKLLKEINKQALANDRVINVFLQMDISQEETKFGMDEKEMVELLSYYEAQLKELQNVEVHGLMGMASYTEDDEKVKQQFQLLANTFQHLKQTYFLQSPYFKELSMGMSGDYKIALQQGSTMVRIGSMLFGERD